jgi:serine/threonine protein phosphatase 1
MRGEMRTFVLGDIHGAYRALRQCLDKSGFDYERDRLIFLGDVYDGWSEADKCVDELIKIKNLIYILGNHDEWVLQWILRGESQEIWLMQGGLNTIQTISNRVFEKHLSFLSRARLYHLENNRLFVHAGFLMDEPIEGQGKDILLWDRSLAEKAITKYLINSKEKITDYDEVYLGHTPTIRYKKNEPLNINDIWLMDTGAGWNGCLSIMNVETKEFFCSDCVVDLYPDEKGRM